MSIEVLGISGSPIENSNTDRLIQAVLDATELECEFVKLSQINIRPCLACKQCVPDNICKVKDDFPELAERIKKAKALIIGAYTPHNHRMNSDVSSAALQSRRLCEALEVS